MWRTEETKTKQRSRDRDIREGDSNTAYFFDKANQRRKKKNISGLEKVDELITDKKA
jgi:hypothetical protein